MTTTDTIAAISTPPGPGAIAIIRLSGTHALRITEQVFSAHPPLHARPPRTLVFGTLHAGPNKVDKCLAVYIPAPNSYTGEDMAEIHTHGGNTIPRLALRSVLDAGARLAQPGEFTRRAFLNGKLDLLQAEAVADLIASRSALAAEAAARQLAGELSASFARIYDTIMGALAPLEATLEFPDEDLPPTTMALAAQMADNATAMASRLLATYQAGRVLRNGLLITIVGPTNAGKSTLLNRLLGRQRAIVTDLPGTTRDTLEESTDINGIPVTLVDTAGLRPTSCPIESEGIRRTEQAISQSDLLILVLDSAHPPDPETLARASELSTRDDVLTIFNKADLPAHPYISHVTTKHSCRISLLDESAPTAVISQLTPLIHRLAPDRLVHKIAISERHRVHLEAARTDLAAASSLIHDTLAHQDREENLVLAASHLRDAADQIATILGRNWTPDLLNSIFSRFCIGK